MSQFIQNNHIWLTPIISIAITIIIRVAIKPPNITLDYTDFLDFGFDLSISSTICLVPGIKNEFGLGLLLLACILIFICSTIVNRVGWNKFTDQRNLKGIIIPDIIGIFLLVIVTLYIGGVIK